MHFACYIEADLTMPWPMITPSEDTAIVYALPVLCIVLMLMHTNQPCQGRLFPFRFQAIPHNDDLDALLYARQSREEVRVMIWFSSK